MKLNIKAANLALQVCKLFMSERTVNNTSNVELETASKHELSKSIEGVVLSKKIS